ncbi:DNA polymerase III subunit alpha [Pontibacter diazotrophicus]|uniref:DNA polymerase III subunit alpha n=1 Tax=Pontibacter diazotrophicus TaxID=1400979 RepID=A0A3D8LHV7_9BACT|nr:DNA polymerase III subunit alpha [Pontibacter diazotrophicus]RDV16977.1 DNA polymerase III subunit alpha [Pontibacter diazotrophicus]
MPVFSHLHTHTQYSLLDGQASISALMKKAQADGMPAVAMTDHGNMFAAFNFVAEANKYNVKPIVGCEFYLVKDRHQKTFTKELKDVRHHQLLLAKDQEGYQNLAKLCSLSYIEGVYSKWPRMDKELLLKYSKGLIATSCCIGAEVPQAILWKTEEEAEEIFKWWLDVFGEDYYIEIQRHGLQNIDGTGKSQEDINQVLLKWAKKYDVKVICTNDTHYVDQDDWNAHDILLCVNTGEDQSTPVGDFATRYYRFLTDDQKVIYDTVDNVRNKYSNNASVRQMLQRIDEAGPKTRFGFPNDQFYFKTQAEMNELFKDVPQAVDNTNEIVDKITPPKLKRDILLPNFPIPPEHAGADAYLRHLTYEGAKKRYTDITPEIEERLDYELRIVETMGFAGYFLIVQDFINRGRDMGVFVGPGRGSAAGSAVAYCIGITNIDPIKYNLLFERFLNPERVSMPDIDIDFDDVNRQRVIDYVVDKYGKTQVAQIITFGTMAAKSSIKDVARSTSLPLAEANEMAKMVPDTPGTTLAKAFMENLDLAAIREGTDARAAVLKLAEKLEGSIRNTGIHAAGVIIAPDDITNYIPVSTSKDSDLLVTQFDGKVIESAGMLKMDFLGLKTLTIIKDAMELIKKNHGVEIDIDNIPIDDEKTYQLYQRGDTIGTFQFESEGMRMYLKDLQPTNIEDLIAMNALYRPGPMQFIPNFINRKHGKEEVEYPHELLEPILNYSYGIMVYQEQIMQTAQILAGYSLGGADLLRRAMGKKDMKKMAEEREKFIAGAAEIHKIPAKKASEVFDVMEKFAQYGFNRSHSAAYSVVAYQTGYLKAHYPAEYMAAVLTNNMNDIKKVTFFIEEARKQGVQVLGPDVNESLLKFNVNEQGNIRFGLAAIKGTGESAVDAIIAERENGLYRDIFDFAKRVNLRAVNKKTFESLALAGGFDSWDLYHRAQLVEVPESESMSLLEKAVRYGNNYQAELQAAQQSLFGGGAAVAAPMPKIPEVAPWTQAEMLRREKEVVGFYMSGHPLDQFKLEIDSYCTCPLNKIEEYKNRDVNVAGMVTDIVIRTARNGNPFALFTVEDYDTSMQMALFGEDYVKFSPYLKMGLYLFIRGKVQLRYKSEDQWELKPQNIQLLGDIMEKMAQGVQININLQHFTPNLAEALENAIVESSGQKRLEITLHVPEEKLALPMYSRKYRIDPKLFLATIKDMGVGECKLI